MKIVWEKYGSKAVKYRQWCGKTGHGGEELQKLLAFRQSNLRLKNALINASHGNRSSKALRACSSVQNLDCLSTF